MAKRPTVTWETAVEQYTIAAVIGARITIVAIGIPQAGGTDCKAARRTSRREREDMAHGFRRRINHPQRITGRIRREDVTAF